MIVDAEFVCVGSANLVDISMDLNDDLHSEICIGVRRFFCSLSSCSSRCFLVARFTTVLLHQSFLPSCFNVILEIRLAHRLNRLCSKSPAANCSECLRHYGECTFCQSQLICTSGQEIKQDVNLKICLFDFKLSSSIDFRNNFSSEMFFQQHGHMTHSNTTVQMTY
jgi:hypothetical protein